MAGNPVTRVTWYSTLEQDPKRAPTTQTVTEAGPGILEGGGEGGGG